MRQISYIVIHRSEEGFTGPEINAAEHPNSYHAAIRQDGTKDYMIAWDEVAYHALSFNKTSVGLVLYGDFAPAEGSRNNTPTPAQLTSIVEMVAEVAQIVLNDGQNMPEIRGHTELGPHGTSFPEKLTVAHACPGSLFDMDWLRSQISALNLTKNNST